MSLLKCNQSYSLTLAGKASMTHRLSVKAVLSSGGDNFPWTTMQPQCPTSTTAVSRWTQVFSVMLCTEIISHTECTTHTAASKTQVFSSLFLLKRHPLVFPACHKRLIARLVRGNLYLDSEWPSFHGLSNHRMIPPSRGGGGGGETEAITAEPALRRFFYQRSPPWGQSLHPYVCQRSGDERLCSVLSFCFYCRGVKKRLRYWSVSDSIEMKKNEG